MKPGRGKREENCVFLFTIYEVRCTIWKVSAPVARGGKVGADGMSQSRDRTWLQRSGGRQGLPMYDVRGTMYDLENSGSTHFFVESAFFME